MEEKKKSKKKTIIIIVSVILGVALIGGIFGEEEPQKEVESSTKTSEETTESTAEVATAADTAENPQDYKASCQEMDYKTLARQPELYKGKNIKVTGEVWQVVEQNDNALYQMNIEKSEYGYYLDGSVQIINEKATDNFRILEDDIITVYGEYKGIVSYTTVLGAKKSIPQISAKYVELQQEETTESN